MPPKNPPKKKKLDLCHGSKVLKCHFFFSLSLSGFIVQISLILDVLSTSGFLICYYKLSKIVFVFFSFFLFFFHTALITFVAKAVILNLCDTFYR